MNNKNKGLAEFARKRRVLACSMFIIAGLIIGTAFVTATSYFQLGVAILLYPLLTHYLLKAFPRNSNSKVVNGDMAVQSVSKSVLNLNPEKDTKTTQSIGIADIDKRAFLKLIGGAGISLFLFSLFNKKSESLFFGNGSNVPETTSIKNTSGVKIDPAERQATDGYQITEIDDDTISFYGFTNRDGSWFIMREDSDSGSYRYTKGTEDFPSNWNTRHDLNYSYYSDVF